MDLDRARQLLERLPIRHRDEHTMVPFRFNPNQSKFYVKVRKQYADTGKVRAIVLKARRVGISSAIDGLEWTYCQAHPNRNAKIVAHQATSSKALFRVPTDLANAYPYTKSENVQERRIIFPHRGGKSLLEIATAGTPSAGRGETLAFLHLSECAMYESGDSFVSMLSAVSKGPDTMIFLESTANGREGPGEDFADYWDGAVRGDNDFVPIFLSWLDDPACIADPEEADDAPADDLEKELMLHFAATRAQIAWMRRTKSTECRNLEQLFLQEYPHTPDVAFQVSGDPAFPRDELSYAESTIKDAIVIGTMYRVGTRYEFKSDTARGHLAVWEYPNPRHKYYIGADAALGGEEGDFAAYTVYNGTTGNIAARFAERIHPEQLADQLDMCGRWYHNALVNVELTGNLGRWTQKLLRDSYMYPNLYRWKGKDDRMRGHHKSIALGFETTQATRRLLFDSFRYALRLGLNNEPGGLSINDRVLMSQMSSATIKDWSWDVRHGHDDVLMASMIAVLTCSQYPPPRFERGNKKPEEDRRQSLGTLSPRVLAVAELNEPFSMRNELKKHWESVRKRPSRDRLAGV